MPVVKGSSRFIPTLKRLLAGPALQAGTTVLSFALLSVLTCWLQGCVLTGNESTDAPQHRSETKRPDTAIKRSDGPAKEHVSRAQPPSREAAQDAREHSARFPEKPSRSATAPTDARRTEISVEKLSGYQVPAEYLFIPSSHYPEATVAVMLPTDYDVDPHKRYPLIIAFGGAGECARPPEQGALAWLRYYKTDEAAKAAESGKLAVSDFRGLVTPKQLKVFNSSLKRSPYKGVILACPSSPPLWGVRDGVDFPEYEAFVMTELIPALQKRYRTDPHMIGVDGVSMGGARSLYYGLKYPAVFSSIGAVQGAFGPYVATYRQLIRDNKQALAHRPIQLVTSDGDVMLRSVENMHKVLRDAAIPHHFSVLSGPHDYIFNQGPGALALLIFHQHALAAAMKGPVR